MSTTKYIVNNQSDQTINGESILRPYKVYTALLTQSGEDNWIHQTDGIFDIGITYMIDTYNAGDDFSNIGGPPAGNQGEWDGYYFVATGTSPLVYTNGSGIDHNTGAPTVTVLENTIGNIWFEYGAGTGRYNVRSNSLFTANKIFTSITNNVEITDESIFTTNVMINGVGTTNQMQVFTYKYNVDGGWNGVVSSNDMLLNTPIEIRVYN